MIDELPPLPPLNRLPQRRGHGVPGDATLISRLNTERARQNVLFVMMAARSRWTAKMPTIKMPLPARTDWEAKTTNGYYNIDDVHEVERHNIR